MWASYWYGDYVVVADNARGIDVLKFNDGRQEGIEDRKEVVAPKMSEAQQRFLAQPRPPAGAGPRARLGLPAPG